MKQLLITYDSGYGSTAAAGEIITEALRDTGLEIDLRPMGQETIPRMMHL